MGLHVIRKGLDLPIAGEPVQEIEPAAPSRRVALIAEDYIGMKPTFLVQAGDTVQRGQALFEDKRNPGVLYTSPGAGTVSAINRGERRALQSVVIELSEGERAGKAEQIVLKNHLGKDLALQTGAQVVAELIEAGLWPAFRTRPFSKVPAPDSKPHSIFITAMDSNPLAASVDVVIGGRLDDLNTGLLAVSKLTDGSVYFCKAAGSKVIAPANIGITNVEFKGPHPSGTPGLHIHLLDPVDRNKVVWHIGVQDVIAIGHLFRTGTIDVSRVISLAGPGVKRPRLLRTRLGASIDELAQGELCDGEQRVISGSVLSGRKAMGEVHGYLGRYHTQVSVVREGREREFLGWLAPGKNKYSTVRAFLSSMFPGKKYAFSTNLHGGARAMVPIGVYERVMPMDLMPTFLLRALIMKDIERAEQLGCLELDEEDLALCTFVCPCKFNYGPILRENLNIIEKEG